MKFLFTFCLLGIVTLFAAPDWASNYENAFDKAKEQGKGVMIMLSKEHCDACWYMENIVLEDEVLVEKLQEKFVPLYLDINDDNIHDLDFIGTPTFYFINSSGETIKRFDGLLNIKEFMAALIVIEDIERNNK
ncbi:MAG: thioredoxin family protein [Helicobacteraceae bacterium]|jgi:thioredoxin-related protein|nr:thioredoxin family protein [Helicobacteraceae bacterium]